MNNREDKQSILEGDIDLYSHQKEYVNIILKSIQETNIYNYFISLPQGAGKTLLSLAIFSELLNKGIVYSNRKEIKRIFFRFKN